MMLQCLECKVKYELNQAGRCPNCESDKCVVLGQLEPWYIKHAFIIALSIIEILGIIYFFFTK